jgi:hypothetical protein
MFLNTFLLAISSSIDSLGIGITYGLRHTKLLKKSKIILFLISIFITFLSGLIGNILKSTLSTNVCEFIGSALLLCMGIFIIIKTNEQEISFDFDNSNDISPKEAIFLGVALSLDSLCIGIGGSTIGINVYWFSILVAILQYVFLSIGNYCGIHLSKVSSIPQRFWSKVSGILLILIGLIKF